MYSPNLGRFIQEDPIGFNGGSANLYVAFDNNPTNRVDPFGLQPGEKELMAKYQSSQWETWSFDARSRFDLSKAPNDVQGLLAFHRSVVGALETYHLGSIPHIDPRKNTAVPAEKIFASALVSESELARINLRYNLLSLKKQLVSSIFSMLKNNLPDDVRTGKPGEKLQKCTDEGEFVTAANLIADAYIRAVDRFLKERLAKAMCDRRNFVGDKLGFENEFNSPWCADWAGAIRDDLGSALTHPSMKIVNSILTTDYAQYNDGYQHNFVILKPRGHTVQLLPKLDSGILILDPWRDLLPRAYTPSATKPWMAPTNIGPKQ